MAIKRKKIDWGKTTEKMVESEKKNYNRDDGYSEYLFTPKLTDKGTWEGIVRFLPRPESDGDGIPFVKLLNHGFQDVGGWFINNCPTTLGKKCPVCENNSRLYSNGQDEVAKPRTRRTSFFVNMLVVKDPQTPANEGKVFIFRYGKKIHEKIMERVSPPEGSIDSPVTVFDYEEGENFKLKIKTTHANIGGSERKFKNFDQSSFAGTQTKLGSDKFIDEIDSKLYNLGAIIAEDKFKDYDVLAEQFEQKIGVATQSTPSTRKPDRSLSTEGSPSVESSSEESEVVEETNSKDFFKNLKEESEKA